MVSGRPCILENVPGFADRILRNFNLSEKDMPLLFHPADAILFPLKWQRFFSIKK